MERHGEEIHVDETEASGGVKKHGVRYVLLISLVLAIGVLSLIWITGALTSTDDAGSYDDTRTAVEAQEGAISTIDEATIVPPTVDTADAPAPVAD
jgi:hypothetical protein